MQHQRRFVVDPPSRVLLLGGPGSGRARLAELVGSRFSLPIITLDGERRALGANEEAWRRRVAEIAAAPKWVMTGNDADSLAVRVAKADWLVFLDMPMSMCVIRVLRASLSRRAEKRRDLEGGIWRALKQAWSFPARTAPRVVAIIEQERRNRTIFILHSNRDLASFLAKLPDAVAPGRGERGASPS